MGGGAFTQTKRWQSFFQPPDMAACQGAKELLINMVSDGETGVKVSPGLWM